MEKRLGAILVLIEEEGDISRINEIISLHSNMVLGRQGIPLRDRRINLLSLVFDGSEEHKKGSNPLTMNVRSTTLPDVLALVIDKDPPCLHRVERNSSIAFHVRLCGLILLRVFFCSVETSCL